MRRHILKLFRLACRLLIQLLVTLRQRINVLHHGSRGVADLRHQLLQAVLHRGNAVAKLPYLPVEAHDVRRRAGEIPCCQPVDMRDEPTQRRNHPSGHTEPDDSGNGD